VLPPVYSTTMSPDEIQAVPLGALDHRERAM